jgi:hypothetical protein
MLKSTILLTKNIKLRFYRRRMLSYIQCGRKLSLSPYIPGKIETSDKDWVEWYGVYCFLTAKMALGAQSSFNFKWRQMCRHFKGLSILCTMVA